MKQTSHTEVIIAAATAIVIIVIASIFFIRRDNSNMPQYLIKPPDLSEVEATYDQGVLPDDSDLQAEYQEKVVDILKVYSPDSLNYDAAVPAYEQVVNELLELKVPASYQAIHLKLVLSFEKLGDAMEKAANDENGALEEINGIRAELDDLFKTYQWLKK